LASMIGADALHCRLSRYVVVYGAIIWVVRAGIRKSEVLMSFRRILIAVEKGPIATHAVDIGLELASTLKAETALIHVAEPPVSYGSDTGIPPAELTALAREEGQRLLTGIRERQRLPSSTLEFLEGGNPVVEILKAAKAWPADLIVVGSHGRSGLDRVLLGSVAEAVVRQAPCPVLVVRARS
jgi:nucleotide-binding universal stress UspA family protein